MTQTIKSTSELDNLSCADIDLYRCNLEVMLKEAISAHEVVEQEKLSVQREILVIQLKKKDLEMSLNKSANHIKLLSLELSIANKKFWSVRNEGR